MSAKDKPKSLLFRLLLPDLHNFVHPINFEWIDIQPIFIVV